MDKNKISEKILQDCFWGDYNITKEDILKIIESGNEWEKFFLFKKIVYNSPRATILLKIFKEEDLKKFFEKLKIANFRKNYFEKKIKVLQKNLLNIKSEVEELKWI